MVSQAAAAPEDVRVQRYRQAEQALWAHYDLEPTERFVDLDRPAVRLRVLEVGSGQPVLFVHGTVGLGAWAPLLHELTGFRCLVVERPGWGLSSGVDYSTSEYKTVVADVLRGVLDALGLDRVDVVSGSIANVWALRLASGHPLRVGRMVLMSGAPLLPEVRVPRIIRLLASPIGAIMVRLPPTPGMERAQLRQNGHAASLAAGRIADAFIAWRTALGRETRSMRNERDMVRALVSRRGWRPGVTFDDAELGKIGQPTLYVCGTNDPVGTVDVWRRAVGLLPQGELHLVDGGGHSPWLDEPSAVGSDVRRFVSSLHTGTAD